ncbi:MAG: bifunctional phosphoglucose/phosphomannose isomerase [Candidatus Woesearchaeota archaeon]
MEKQKTENSKNLSFPDDYMLLYDKAGMKREIDSLASQIMDGYKLGENVKLDVDPKSINKVVFAGMGGSAIAGDILRIFLHKYKMPVFVVRNYELPEFVDKNTLLFVQSYSGNTEETVSAFRSAIRIGCKIIAVTSGGRIEKMAAENKIPLIRLPRGYQPRAVLGLEFFSALRVLENIGMLPKFKTELEKLSQNIAHERLDKTAIELSEKLVGKIPLVYSSANYYPIAFRWKTQLNENAKTMAFASEFSELNHNELVGYVYPNGSFYVLMLKFDDELRRIAKRMEITKGIIQQKGVEVTEVGLTGNSLLVKLFTAIRLGDLTSYYLALRYKQNPMNVDIIENFKKEMGPFI